MPKSDAHLLDALAQETINGLCQPLGQKWLSPNICYAAPATRIGNPIGEALHAALSNLDAPQQLPPFQIPGGPVLFDNLINVPGYYPLFAEAEIVKFYAARLKEIIENSCIVEFGVGDGTKTWEFFDLLGAWPQKYIGIDISRGNLELAREKFPKHVKCEMIEADFTGPKFWPEIQKKLQGINMPTIGFIPGSTLGNFPLSDVKSFLSRARQILNHMLVALDSTQEKSLLTGAYGKPVTPVALQFYLNGLVQAGRHIDFIEPGVFNIVEPSYPKNMAMLKRLPVLVENIEKKFAYDMRYDRDKQRVDMGIISREKQTYFRVPEPQRAALHTMSDISIVMQNLKQVTFEEGERIHCINSHKWDRPTLETLFGEAGWRMGEPMSFESVIQGKNVLKRLPGPFRSRSRAGSIDYNMYFLS